MRRGSRGVVNQLLFLLTIQGMTAAATDTEYAGRSVTSPRIGPHGEFSSSAEDGSLTAQARKSKEGPRRGREFFPIWKWCRPGC